MKRLLCITALMALANLLTSCTGYQLKQEPKTPFSSIYVVPVTNTALAAQAAPIVGRELIQAIVARGGIEITAEGESDAVVTTNIIDYRKDTTTNRSDDSGRAFGARLILIASVTLTNAKTGEVYFKDRQFEAQATAYDPAGGTMTNAEYTTMTTLCKDLTARIADAISSAW